MIYFIREGNDGPIKIGYSNNVRRRMATLQTASARPLQLLGITEGSIRDEHDLHDRFGAIRLQGEWFEATPALLHFIAHTMRPTVKERLWRNVLPSAARTRIARTKVTPTRAWVSSPPAQHRLFTAANIAMAGIYGMTVVRRGLFALTWITAVLCGIELILPTGQFLAYPRFALFTLGIEALFILWMISEHKTTQGYRWELEHRY